MNSVLSDDRSFTGATGCGTEILGSSCVYSYLFLEKSYIYGHDLLLSSPYCPVERLNKCVDFALMVTL